jgi:hypothetical protein
MPNFKLFLKTIKYTGKNIGKDLEFVIRISGASYSQKLNLTNWTKKEFDPPEFISEIDFDSGTATLSRKMSILVIEDDPTKNDYGKSDKIHRIKVSNDGQFEFSQIVKVRERGGVRTKKNVANFELIFSADFSSNRNDDQEKLNLPNLSPPITWTKSTGYHPHSCDIVCLRKCHPFDVACKQKCCN